MRDLLTMAEAYENPPDDQHLGWVELEDILSANSDVAIPEDYFQLVLMAGAGWVEGDAVEYGTFRITNAGYDYLDAVRDEGVWSKTKTVVAETGGNAALEVVKALAIAFGKKKIEQHTGLTL